MKYNVACALTRLCYCKKCVRSAVLKPSTLWYGGRCAGDYNLGGGFVIKYSRSTAFLLNSLDCGMLCNRTNALLCSVLLTPLAGGSTSTCTSRHDYDPVDYYVLIFMKS